MPTKERKATRSIETVLYLASSPFQIVGCSEFRHAITNQRYAGLPPRDSRHVLVIKSSGATIECDQLEQTRIALGWEEPIWLSTAKDCSSGRFMPPSVTVMLRQIQQIRGLVAELAPSTVVSGTLRNPVPEAALMSAEHRVIVDDGPGTQDYYLRKPLRLHHLLFLRARARNEATKRIARTLSGQFQFRFSRVSLHWFSAYKVCAAKDDVTTQHDFSVLRERLGKDFEKRISSNCVLFVAPPDGLVSMETQLRALERIRACNPSAELVYAPHRGTSRETLAVIASVGTVIRESRATLELDLADYSKLPGAIYGFQSTVLANALLLSREWKVFNIVSSEQPHWAKKLSMNAQHVADLLARLGCQTFDLEIGQASA